ncbi:APC family permease [Subtercola sp. YIM 133946]|uniref:APC family permease n=1 Tax=Subtercola sp. YIM 133946 TaxID=3118909 RepID=UPI002F92D9D2
MTKIAPSADPAVTAPAAPSNRLSGKLGATAIVFMVVAAAAPLTVIASSPIGMALTNGGGVPFNYLAAGVVLLVFAVGFTTMAHHITDAGAFYTFVGSGLGRVIGGGAAFLALFSYLAIQTAIYAFLGFSASNLVASAGLPDTPWYLWSALAMLIVAFLGYRNIDLSAKVLGVLLILEVLVIVVLSLAVLLKGGSTGGGVTADSFTPAVIMSGPVGLGVMLAFGGFTGFESTAIFRDEARVPHKTIPRATYAAVIGIGVFYTLATWMLVEAWGSGAVQSIAVEHTGDLVQLTATTYVGQWLATAVSTLLVTSLFACVISFHNVISRYLHSIGRVGLLPTRLSTTHSRHRSPHFASIFVTAASVALLVLWVALGWDPLLQVFTLISSSGAIGIILLFVLTSVSVVVFFARTKLDRRPWNTVIAPIVALVGLIAILVLAITNFSALTGTPEPALNTVLILAPVAAFLVGAGVVLWVRRRRPATYRSLLFHDHTTQNEDH